jgi:hypothetical protein
MADYFDLIDSIYLIMRVLLFAIVLSWMLVFYLIWNLYDFLK